MLNITEELINSLASNESAVNNGKSLVKNKAFVNMSIARDESIIMGGMQRKWCKQLYYIS